MSALTVKRDDAVALLGALDYQMTKGKWPNSRVIEKLNGLKSIIGDDTDEIELDDEQKKLLKLVLAADDIEIDGDEEGAATPVPATKPTKAAKPAKAAPAAKKAKAAPAPAKKAMGKKAPAPATKKAMKGPSNKRRVFQAWSKLKNKDRADAAELQKKAMASSVKLTTVQSWISSWKAGKYIPQYAQKE